MEGPELTDVCAWTRDSKPKLTSICVFSLHFVFGFLESDYPRETEAIIT